MKFFAWIFGNKIEPGIKIPKSPHEIFPEIMHWKVGDKLSLNDDRTCDYYVYEGVSEEGTVFYKYFDGTELTVSVERARKFINCSLQNDKIKKEKQSTNEYMQLMKDFQKAYKEISGD